jgi:hypothetical protein
MLCIVRHLAPTKKFRMSRLLDAGIFQHDEALTERLAAPKLRSSEGGLVARAA